MSLAEIKKTFNENSLPKEKQFAAFVVRFLKVYK
jgi:hypothetical protein